MGLYKLVSLIERQSHIAALLSYCFLYPVYGGWAEIGVLESEIRELGWVGDSFTV